MNEPELWAIVNLRMGGSPHINRITIIMEEYFPESMHKIIYAALRRAQIYDNNFWCIRRATDTEKETFHE
jgi:hypothetical protein